MKTESKEWLKLDDKNVTKSSYEELKVTGQTNQQNDTVYLLVYKLKKERINKFNKSRDKNIQVNSVINEINDQITPIKLITKESRYQFIKRKLFESTLKRKRKSYQFKRENNPQETITNDEFIEDRYWKTFTPKLRNKKNKKVE
ncbi:hypothetical protein M0812_18847 [Anaeramoeba flamelloides]|uniref:Uncharacterized protein n=1 Tax=Anaeramoeba flamelloides TaxID=1746091 RepID=A0AAV7Z9R5_9EUKA|nr:hypothetical protein M0812_18847 [Anaeramoeba flamelloides]